ncbi:hypothetical protein [Bacillus sp. FJAT-27445]|uniref:hypothetical protein n=1 Tax=Bacillus sp. FJAT-27445 TaxID=1679166 RepID=UPI0007444B0F|nr:hypothetical protein [Bacillus sp. FJAT-27445]
MSIQVLKGSNLSSVIFIRDYIQFVFEGEDDSYILTSLVDETVVKENITFKRQTEGWRDALCSLINKVVKIAIENEGVSLNVLFEDGDILQINLIEEDLSFKGKEAAHLFYRDQIVVWHSY